MTETCFAFRVTGGWLRDLASEPTPGKVWPCIDWDEPLERDQRHFLDVQREVGVDIHAVWGLFVNRAWPVELRQAVGPARADQIERLVAAAHQRKLLVMSGVGIYSWGFEDIIAANPGVASGSRRAMCLSKPAAWDWQRRVLDFIKDPRWQLDGVSMQSADQGRCECPECCQLTPAEYHAAILTRSAAYIRANRPDWVIGQASWGRPLENVADLPALAEIADAVDYMVEVNEIPGRANRLSRISHFDCAYGTVGGVFIEPPQHWDRLRWCVPCGLRSARSLQTLWDEGGHACEYFFRPFANPVEEVSWRTGGHFLSDPYQTPEECLRRSVKEVYRVSGPASDDLTDWFKRAEDAYFSRSSFTAGSGPLSLEPLIWNVDPAAVGPAVYLLDWLTPAARQDYATDLAALKAEFLALPIPDPVLKHKTITALQGTLNDLGALL